MSKKPLDSDEEFHDEKGHEYTLTKEIDALHKHKIDKKREKLVDQSAKRAAFESVMDERTVFHLNKLMKTEIISDIEGIISAGKEANVYLGYDPEGKEVAIKVYKIDMNTSKWMKNYIIGDPRFKKIPKNISKIIFLWAGKEFKNLSRAKKAGLTVPKPLFVRNNILIMEYIGFGTIPAPKLKDIDDPTHKEELMNQILDFIKILYQEARLVHGDLSEFNILYHNQKPVIIDISQAVSIDHPKAEVYLVRDIKNMISYFEKLGIGYPDPEEFYYEVINK